MSVWKQLYDTYEMNLKHVGEFESRWEGQDFTLLPLSHTTQTAHVTVTVTLDGDFHSATVIEKGHGNTLIPGTEDSANRAGSVVAPYPLHDKLAYVAGDFLKYGGIYKGENAHHAYLSQLKAWVETAPYDPLESIYRYVQKGQLIEDLIQEGIFSATGSGELRWTWKEAGDKPPIYGLVTGGLEGTFVRFQVRSTDGVQRQPWRDKAFFDSFITFYGTRPGKEGLCFVTGKQERLSSKHTNKIRNSGDKAKLISANDSSGFTFRGRFDKPDEAASISYQASQKAHNALKWLIQRQGRSIDQRVFLIWGNQQPSLPNPLENTLSLAQLFGEEEELILHTVQEGALAFSDALLGFKRRLPKQEVNILTLDAATTGRMAILYYRTFDQETYFKRLEQWHTKYPWEYIYQDADKKRQVYIGAPSLKDIALMTYGTRGNEKLIKATVERLLSCVIDERCVPTDIIRCLTQRASNPVGMDHWEWEKTLSIACGMVNKKEEMTVSLDQEINDRDYLFGRLLALADYLERRALGQDNRATNAIRYMNAFSQNPARTWMTIQSALQPYQAKLGGKVLFINRQIDEIGSRLTIEQFTNKPLSGKYLLGFYSQRHELYQKREETFDKEERGEA